MPEFKLIIGLGNPGEDYQNTNHNIGLMAVDFMGKGMKSEVYMNKSGEFVRQEIKKAKVKPENLLVIHDDSDIELGKYKLSFGRSSAGHRGVQNIIDQLRTDKFWRLRIGIRPATEKARTKAEDLVLKKISSASKKKLELVFKAIKNIVS